MAEAGWQNTLQRNTAQLSSLGAACQASLSVHTCFMVKFSFFLRKEREPLELRTYVSHADEKPASSIQM